jgi:PAS domain S-box-containing protein
LLGHNFDDNLPAEIALIARRYSDLLFETGVPQRFENRLEVDGQVRYRETRMVKLNDNEALAIVRDITQQEQVAQHLSNERAHLLALYEAIPDAIIRLNRTGQYLSHKPARHSKPYKNPDATLGGYIEDNVPAPVAKMARYYLDRLFETDEIQRFEHTHVVDGMMYYRENRLVKLSEDEAVAIVRDLTEQKQAELALQESKQRLDLAIEAAELGIWDRYADAEDAVVNKYYRHMLGLSQEQAVRRQATLDSIHPDDIDHVMDDFAGLYDGTKPRHSHERRQRHADGSYRWLRVTGATVAFDEQAKPLRFVMAVQDIHTQKMLQLQLEQALKEKTVLLAEVHHRVKNNMQIIGSIMSLHARETNQPEAKAALMSSRTRIRTMAAIHEVMYNTEVFSDLDFSTYLQTIARSLVQFSTRDVPVHTADSRVRQRRQPPKLQFDLAPVTLDMQDALPCALIFNELLSNALKHAFPETVEAAEPTIHIELRQASTQIRLTICDNGVGVSSTQKNFGSFIVDTLVEQLQGSLELSSVSVDPPQGTRAVLLFNKMAN